MIPTWLSLLPPLIVIASALAFRHMNTAFLIGITSAGLVATKAHPYQTILLAGQRLWATATDVDTLCLFAFLIAVGSLIALFERTNCVDALTRVALRKLNSKASVERSSIGLSCILFVDDYLSILTTGHVIRSITDRFGIPRQKLAFLIHALAGSVVILAPISSWVAAITAQLSQAGVSATATTGTLILADPFFVYLQTVPFMFFSFLIMGSVWFIVRNHISFGPMQKREQEAHAHHAANNVKPPSQNGSLIELLLPLATLLIGMFSGLLYGGNYWLFGGNNSLIEAIKSNQNPFWVMFVVSVCALIVGISLALYKRSLSLSHTPHILLNGARLMRGAIIMVFFSSTLATMLKGDVLTGQYLATLLIGSVSTIFLPALFFVVSLICALVTGSAWGTFSLMLSIAIPMLASLFGAPPVNPELVPLLFPVLGAIFSGAVCGDLVSPISETTVMSATSTQINPVEHAYTQFPYVLPAALCTLFAFLLSGFLAPYGRTIALVLPLGSAIALCFGMLYIANNNKR